MTGYVTMPQCTLFSEDRYTNLQIFSRDKDMIDTFPEEQESM